MTRGKYYIDKKCINMGGSKNAKDYNEKKRLFIIYQRTKSQKLSSPKDERVEKPT